jgi:AraC-like DNA-binding protein
VREDLEKLGVEVHEVKIGRAEISFDPQQVALDDIHRVLQEAGFSILKSKDEQLIEEVKIILNQIVSGENSQPLVNNSDLLARETGTNYNYLSRIFSQQQGITIEKYLIRMKIDKVKELLKYENQSSEEIAFRMNYSSLAHLSRQFKEVTGYTITEFKKMIRA